VSSHRLSRPPDDRGVMGPQRGRYRLDQQERANRGDPRQRPPEYDLDGRERVAPAARRAHDPRGTGADAALRCDRGLPSAATVAGRFNRASCVMAEMAHGLWLMAYAGSGLMAYGLWLMAHGSCWLRAHGSWL